MKKRILVIGELNVDLVVSGLRDLPRLGREVLGGDARVVLGSSSAICAAGLARLGAEVDFLGKVGVDCYGDLVAAELRRLGVGTRHLISDPTVPTGVTISLTYPHDRALITVLGSIAELRPADIPPIVFTDYCHVHVGSYFLQKGLQTGLATLFDQARDGGLTVSLDTGWDPEEQWSRSELLGLLEKVDVFLPNEEEAREIAPADDTEQALHELGKRARLVVVKRGPAGATAIRQGEVLNSPGFAMHTVDTTGAGDSFDAGFLFAYVLQGWQLAEALRLANACGALSTTGFGGTAAQPTFEQVLEFLHTFAA